MRAVLSDEQRVGGGVANTHSRSRQITDTPRSLNFQKDAERGVREKLMRFESFLNPPSRILPYSMLSRMETGLINRKSGHNA